MAQVEQTDEGERLADTPTGASGDPGGAISEPTELQRPRPLNRGGRKWWSLAGVIVCMGACVVSAGLFLPHQSLWNDEATQLCGVGLDPVEVTRWLAGWSLHDFGIPSDRMPPVSYWAQQAWAKVFGLSELAMRSFSLVCVAASILVVHSAARRAWGGLAGFTAGIVFALSPNVVTCAIEIRSYPLFLLESAVMFWFLMRLLEDSRDELSDTPFLVGIVLTGILAIFTHFFGLLLSGGVFLALLVLNRDQSTRLWRVLAGIVTLGVAALGLLPFIQASIAMGKNAGSGLPAPSEGRYVMIVRLVYRLVSHPSMSAGPILVGVVLGGAVLAVLAALAPKRSSGRVTFGLLIALVSGFLVAAAAQLAQSSFQAALPSYNIWMLPALFLVMASGLAARSGLARGCAIVGIALITVGELFGVSRLATAGDYFAHTSYGPIARLIEHLGPEKVAVLYDESDRVAWHIYSPMWYTYGRRVPQYSLESSSDPGKLRVVNYPNKESEQDPRELDVDYLIVVKAKQEWAADLWTQLKQGPAALGDGPLARALLASRRWQRMGEKTFPSYVACDVDLFVNSGRKAMLPDDPWAG